MSAVEKPLVNPDLVLAKALLKASQQLGLKQSDTALIIGVHRTAISHLKKGQPLSPTSKQGELALLLIRLARALFALTGGDDSWIQHFMHKHNDLTGGVPAQQIQSIQGLVKVLQVVDAIRGKV